MQSKQSHYNITYDDFNDSYLCNIDGETISANFVGEILSYIAKLYDYEPKIIYSELHYAKVLEDELNITIKLDFSYQEDVVKLYMIRKEFLDGSKVYRSAGVYDKWTHSGKCWSNGAFKSFLNYSKLTLDVLKRDAITYKITVIEVDIDSVTIEETPILEWCMTNLIKEGK